MSKIVFLGTSSGSEPIAGMHHCSVLFEINGSNYFFDCGEGCGYNAFIRGIDVTKTRAVFISHMHIDHIGGFPHLLYTMQKMGNTYFIPLENNNTLEVYVPKPKTFQAIMDVASDCGEDEAFTYKINCHKISDGPIYEDEKIKVTAYHNTHLKEDGTNGWHSYSFLIEALGKKIVFSGDVGKPCEVLPLVGDGADIAIMETGHHHPKDVCDFAAGENIGVLYLNHHGRAIINNRDEMERLVREHPQNAYITYDGLEIPI